jgi:hypothetical protein
MSCWMVSVGVGNVGEEGGGYVGVDGVVYAVAGHVVVGAAVGYVGFVVAGVEAGGKPGVYFLCGTFGV